MEECVLSVSGLNISFGKKDIATVVSNVSFDINASETLAIVGESGSGKSITALSIMGLQPQTANLSGTITLTEKEQNYVLTSLNKKDWSSIRGNGIGMVFQEPMSSLNPIMKVGRQLVEAILLHQKVSKKEAKEIAVDWFDKVQISNAKDVYDKYPHQLSGGQKQRVMIAMAMCNHPSLLIADEPTTALDVTVQQEVVALMKELQKEHDTAIIFITHDLALASSIADKVLVMYDGEAVEYGNTPKVMNSSENAYTKALLACRPSVNNKGKRLPIVSDFLKNTNEENEHEVYTPIVTDDVALSVKDLRVWYEQKKDWKGNVSEYYKAVDGVGFELKKGEVLGLVGESGCGKSTISRSLMGLLPIREGQIIFEGKDLATLKASEWKSVRKDVQMIFQDPFASLNPRMTIGNMLMEPMSVHEIVPTSELKKEAERLLDLVQLPKDVMSRYPHQFSGGQRQRLGIARALAVRPKLILCDESVSALDISVQAQILNLLKDLQQEFSLSYLFISHDLNVVHHISDRVMVMQSGKFVEIGDATKVLHHPSHEYTKRLIASIP